MKPLAAYTWEDLDEMIELARDEAVEADTIPESIALIFHDDGLSGMLFTPTFFTDTAEVITDTLCEVLPTLRARGIAIVWPAVYTDEDGELWAMKVHRWDADEPDRMRTQLWPLPIFDTPDGPPMDVDQHDPWSQRLARALTDPDPSIDLGVVNTAGLGEGFELSVAPGGALDTPILHTLN